MVNLLKITCVSRLLAGFECQRLKTEQNHNIQYYLPKELCFHIFSQSNTGISFQGNSVIISSFHTVKPVVTR